MECVDGTTLDDALREGPLPVHEAVDYGAQIADALVAAHEAGIVHRDLKSKNVCVTKSGIAKVLDFGLSIHTHHHLRDRSASGRLEEPPLPAGTLPYMAPEAIRGERLDERTDIWSLGLSCSSRCWRDTGPFQGTASIV